MATRKQNIFLIISSSFMVIATVGFLLIQCIFEDNIKKRSEDNIELISSQQSVVDYMEKANSYREFAILASSQQDVLKALNVSNDILQNNKSNLFSFYRFSVIHTINAVSASKKWGQSESDKKVKEINTLSVDQLKDKYLEYLKIAAEGTEELQKKLSDNEISILNLDKYKKICWYTCFSFQSFGLIIGLGLVVLNKP